MPFRRMSNRRMSFRLQLSFRRMSLRRMSNRRILSFSLTAFRRMSVCHFAIAICWYGQYWYCWYQPCRLRAILLSISTIVIIAFMYYWYRQLELSKSVLFVHCWYPQFQLSISLMHNLNNTNCWYQQIIVDIHNLNYGYRHIDLLISTIISTIVHVDVDNSNCWYQQWTWFFNIDYSNGWYQK